jgi:hypothetical protein
MLYSSALDLDPDPPSFRESSTDTSLNSSGHFASPATSGTSLDLTNDTHAPLTDKALAEESLCSFDWSNWEDWMLWDGDNNAAKSHDLQTSLPMSTINPSLPSTSEDREISNTQNSTSLGSVDMSIDATNPFVFKGMPSEYGLFDPRLTFDNELQFPVELTKPSTGTVLDSNSFPLEQLQFGAIADAYSSLHVEQSARQNLDFQSFSVSEQSLSPASASHRSASMSSPGSSPYHQSRKRKSSADDDDADSQSPGPKRALGKKAAHKMVEKKYRMNLNDKIAALRDSIPNLRQSDKHCDDDDDNLDGESRRAPNPNKGVVLTKAMEYIRHLERRNKKLSHEMTILKMRADAFRTLAITRSIGLNGGTIQDPKGVPGMYADETQQPYQANSQAVRQDEAHALTRNAQSVRRQSGVGGGGGGGYMSKLMVGSLAGLMIIQGFNENEQAEDTSSPSMRGLLGLPTQFMGSLRHMLHPRSNALGPLHISSLESPLVLLKAVLFMGAILYVIYPSFFDAKPREEDKAKRLSDFTLTEAPSLASPVEVRRSAWLTAVQTVWVPRQSFLLQILALLVKSLKLFLRSAIGWHGYAMLTGATEDQETARVKAWEIALDAQLAGGDAEISMSRLILTMLASGTLPETPYRHMLKALHMHVLLWEAAQSGLGGGSLCRNIAAKFAKWQWEKARKLQKQVNSLPPSNDEASGGDRLPDYLARLLDMDSDAVMVDAVVQRAYNLAWNKPTADKISGPIDGMDSVVEDPAIRSPLDALAAWYSSLVLHNVLINFLEAKTGKADRKAAIPNDLDIALKIAPRASLVQSRCLVARAVLLDESRGANIAAALQALPISSLQSINCAPTNPKTASPGFIRSPIPPDPALAIRCAMAIALLKRPQSSKEAIAFCGQFRFSHNTLGLFGFTAMYNFLDAAFRDKDVANDIRDVLENFAGTLKIWIGQKHIDNSGLEKEAMVNVASLCLEVFNWLIGMKGE